jgi:photosystem I subunit 3
MKGRMLSAKALLLGCVLTLAPLVQAEDLGGTVPCATSEAFAKVKSDRLTAFKDEIAKLAPGTEFYNQRVAKQKEWEFRYGLMERNAQCDKGTGYPHLIVDGRLSHAGDFLIPSVLFLWIAGALGWAGRDYLMKTGKAEDEIMIDFSKAVPSWVLGLLWPLQAIPQLISGSIRDEKVKP